MDLWPERTGSDWLSNIQQCGKKGITNSRARDQVEGKCGSLMSVSCFVCDFNSCASIWLSVLRCFALMYNMLLYIDRLRFALWLYLLVWDITKCNECPPWTVRALRRLYGRYGDCTGATKTVRTLRRLYGRYGDCTGATGTVRVVVVVVWPVSWRKFGLVTEFGCISLFSLCLLVCLYSAGLMTEIRSRDGIWVYFSLFLYVC